MSCDNRRRRNMSTVQLLEEEQAARLNAFWEKLEAKGLVAKRKPAPPTADEPFQPIHCR